MPQLSKFLYYGQLDWEIWVALIHEQGHSGQNQFWELVYSIQELTGQTGPTWQTEHDPK